MQVSKWGNSLAIRLPAAVVEALELKEGDEIDIYIAEDRKFEVTRNKPRQLALERLRRLSREPPARVTFNREVANER